MKVCGILGILCSTAMALVSHQAAATAANGIGAVVGIGSGSDNHVTIDGFTPTNTTCPLLNGRAYLMFRPDDNGKQIRALAMAAMLAGKRIGVGVDDTDKATNGYCFVKWMNLTT